MHGVNRRQWMTRALALGALGWAGVPQAASRWPDRPIRVISAGSPGGGSDIFVRLIEEPFTARLGQSLIIDNRPGAGGMLAAGLAANAAPDGQTLFVSNVATNAIGLSLYAKPSFNPATELPAVARLVTLSNAIAVRPETGIESVQDLIAFLRANPQKGFYGSAGVGTSSHLTAHAFGQRIGVPLSHVPYKGTAANLNALLAGETLFAIDNVPLYVQHVKAGTLRLLAVTQAQRLADYPEVPTVQEAAGIGEFDVYSWYGISTATGTPPERIERLGADIVASLNDPDVVARIRAAGATAAPLGPAAYADFIRQEIAKWSQIVKSSGAQV